MDLQYISAKNNEKIFTVNSIYYHSSYNPQKEAERFIETYSFTQKKPDLILVIEPGFSYLYKPLKTKFPEAKIGCIRLFPDLKENPDLPKWDVILKKENLYNQFISRFSEEKIVNAELMVWKPALQFFNEEVNFCFNQYKEAVSYAKTILTTRQYFEKKWLINSLNFFKYTKNFCKIENTDLPVVIAASGPSLEKSLNTLVKNRNKFFLLCLSSALPVLINYNLIPDLVMSTDGGFYANEHLKPLNENCIPVALSPESFISRKLLQKLPVVPLDYNEGISSRLFEFLKIPGYPAKRNGTVSGTALEFARNLTENNIYFCGLDLAFSKGFQHTQPNILELNASAFDTKLASKEQRISRSSINNSSLDIYKNWFASLENISGVYRVIEKSENRLGLIKDISVEELEKNLKESTEINSSPLIKKQRENKPLLSEIKTFIELNLEDIKKQVFPVDFVNLKHCTDEKSIVSAEKNLNEKTENLLLKIRKIIND